MAKKNNQAPIFREKDWDLKSIDLGIQKLQRRIEQVNSLSATNSRYDEQIVDNVESDVVRTIQEVFGNESPEYNEHQYHKIWHGPMTIGDSVQSRQNKFLAGIPKTATMLEGLINRLKEKRQDLASDEGQMAQATLQGLPIHPEIYKSCWKLFRDGHYANAVFEASKRLVNLVKEKSGRSDKDGADLMFAIFSKNNPILAANAGISQSDKDEQEGLMHLFVGAVQALRNPRGHESWEDSPEEALDYVAFISFLAKRLENCNLKVPNPGSAK